MFETTFHSAPQSLSGWLSPNQMSLLKRAWKVCVISIQSRGTSIAPAFAMILLWAGQRWPRLRDPNRIILKSPGSRFLGISGVFAKIISVDVNNGFFDVPFSLLCLLLQIFFFLSVCFLVSHLSFGDYLHLADGLWCHFKEGGLIRWLEPSDIRGLKLLAVLLLSLSLSSWAIQMLQKNNLIFTLDQNLMQW